MNDNWCQYEDAQQRDGEIRHYRCRVCGHERESRYGPEMLRRLCMVGVRKRLESDIADDVNPETRSMDEIRMTLNACFAGCRHMKRHCTRFGKSRCERYQAWIEHLLENDCTPE
jgi:hypothetical protein